MTLTDHPVTPQSVSRLQAATGRWLRVRECRCSITISRSDRLPHRQRDGHAPGGPAGYETGIYYMQL